MEENQGPKFKISGNEEPEDIRQDELRDLKMEKLGHRVTLLIVLIPCMIGIIGVIAYLDIKDRVTRSQDTGAISVQKLSKDLASKFSSLSLEQARIKDLQANKLPQLEKDAAFLRSKLSDLQKSVARLSNATINRDELGRVVDNLIQKVNDAMPEGITADVETLKADLAALNEVDDGILAAGNKRQAAIASLSNSLSEVRADIEGLRVDIDKLEDTAIDKSELELALKLKEIGYRQFLLEQTAQLSKEIEALRKRVEKLSAVSKSPSAGGSAQSAPPKPAPQPAQSKPEPPPQADNPDTPAGSQPGNDDTVGIVEQTIE